MLGSQSRLALCALLICGAVTLGSAQGLATNDRQFVDSGAPARPFNEMPAADVAPVVRPPRVQGLEPLDDGRVRISQRPDAGGGALIVHAGTSTLFDLHVDQAAPGDAVRLNTEIARRVIGTMPEPLADERTLSNWLEVVARLNLEPSHVSNARVQRFREGTEFEQKQLLTAFRDELARFGTQSPMRVTRIRRVFIGRYDEGRGEFPIEFSRADFAAELQLGGEFGTAMTLNVVNWPSRPALRMPQAEAIAFAKRLTRNRYIDLAAQFTVSGFEKSADGRSVIGLAQLEQLWIHKPPTQKASRLGERLMPVLPSGSPNSASAGPATGPAAAWGRFGAKVIGDTIIHDFGADPAGSRKANADGLFQPLLAAALKKAPDQARRIDVAFHASRILLARDRHASLFSASGGGYAVSDIVRDEFKRREIIRRFERELFSEITQLAPSLPVKLRLTTEVSLSKYDFERGEFGLDSYFSSNFSGSGAVLFTELASATDLQTNITRFPRRVAMSERDAQALADRLGRSRQGGRKLFAALDLSLESVEMRSVTSTDDLGKNLDNFRGVNRLLSTARVVRLTMFEDAALTRVVREFPAEELVSEPNLPAPPVAVTPDLLPKLAVAPSPRLTSWSLVQLAAREGAGPDLLEDAARTAQAYLSANEFDQARVLAEVLGHGRERGAPTGSAIVAAELELGRHDGSSGFAITRSSLRLDQPGKLEPASGIVQIAVANPESLQRLAASVEVGRLLVEASSNRTFRALLRVTPSGAKRLPSSSGQPRAELRVRVEQVMLLHPKESGRVILNVNPALQPAAKLNVPALAGQADVRLARNPARVPLTDETMVLFTLREAGREPDPATLHWLMRRRWEIERDPRTAVGENGDGNPWGQFFPADYRELRAEDLTRFESAFKAWNKLRVSSLPNKITLYWPGSHSTPRFGDRASEYAEEMASLGLDRREFLEMRGNSVFERARDPLRAGFVNGGVLALGRRIHYDGAEGYILLGDLPAPALPPDYEMYADLDITRVELTVRDTGKPIITFQTSPTAVRWWSDRTSITQRYLLASLKVDPVAPREKRVPPSLDIVGLRLGLSAQEADEIISKHMPVRAVIEFEGAVHESSSLGTITRQYISESGLEFITILLLPESLSGKVLGVQRLIHFGEADLFEDTATDMLVAKYGPTAEQGRLAWGARAHKYGCSKLEKSTGRAWEDFRHVRGTPLGPYSGISQSDIDRSPSIAAELRTTRRALGEEWPFTLRDGDYSQCGPVVIAERYRMGGLGFAGERIPDDASVILNVVLFDHKAHSEAISAAKRDAVHRRAKPQTPGAATPQVKL